MIEKNDLKLQNHVTKRVYLRHELSKEQIAKQSGITLIALVVTIVVLLILAGITISLVFVQNGVISKAQEAKEQTEISQIRDQLELAKASVYIDGLGKIDLDDYFQKLEDEGIINDKDKDVVEIGDGVYEVTTDDGYIFTVTEGENGNIEIDYIGKVDGPRIRDINVTNKTTNSITVEVDTSNAEGASYTYSYKKDEEDKWTEANTTEENTYTFNGLEANVIYNIKVVVEKDGKSAEKETSTLTGELPEGAIQFEPITWSNGEASTIITTSEDGYTLQYQINGIVEESWINTTSGTTINGLHDGDRVYGRLFDGTNGSKTSNVNVEDLQDPTVAVNKGTITTNSIAVGVQAVDNESGMADTITYKYYIKQTSEADTAYVEKASNNNASYAFTGLTQNTSYDIKVEVTGDKAGNTGTGKLLNQTTGTVGGATEGLKQGNITASTPVWSGGTASITLSTTTGLTIQWQKNSISGAWTTGTSVTGLNHNDTVYARLWDGTNAGTSASVKILDSTAPKNATISLSSTNVSTGTNVTATVTHNDSESGPNITKCKYIWNTSSAKLGTDESLYTGGTFSSNGQQISRSMTSKGTYYLHVLTVDKAGNAIETVSNAITVVQLATSVSVSPTSVTLDIGTTRQLTATVNPTTANNRTVTWTSSNSNIASVSTSGLVTAKAEGSVTITATTKDGSNKKATCSVTVSNPKTYHWSKYSVIDVNTYKEETTKAGTMTVGGSISLGGDGFWSSYSFNTSTGKFSGAGNYYGSSITASTTDSYHITADRVTRYQLESSRTFRLYYTTAVVVSTQKGKGDYIESVTSSSSSAYPTNGQSGSYWYVYDGYY